MRSKIAIFVLEGFFGQNCPNYLKQSHQGTRESILENGVVSMDVVGEVMSVKGDRAVVRTARHATCNRCGACGLFSNTPDMEVEAVNQIGAVPGDRVQMSIESRSVLEAAFLAYMVPLFLFIIGIVGGYQAARRLWPAIRPEWLGIPAGFALMVAGYAYLRGYDRRASQKGKYLPHITGFDRD